MSDATEAISRQAIALPGGSCDMRLGSKALDRLGSELRILAGRPRVAVLLAGDTVSDDLMLTLSRSATDAGFLVRTIRTPHGPGARTLEAVNDCWRSLAELGVTGDDVIITVGDVDVLSASTFVATTWCSGTSLVMVALDAGSVVEAVTTPRGLDVSGSAQMVRVNSHTQMLFCDTDVMDWKDEESNLYARVVAVSSAVGNGEAAFSDVGLRADALVAGDLEVVCKQLLETTRQRGRMVSATSVAVRQGVLYGVTFSRALAKVLGQDAAESVGRGRLLAEGLRFASRLSVGVSQGDVDFVFAQDALLDKLGATRVACRVDVDELLGSLKAEGLLRSNRYLFALPLAYGRIRLTAVPDETMEEHLKAWCASHARLAAKAEAKGA